MHAEALGRREAAPRIASRAVVYGGEESQKLSRGELLSWRDLDGFGWLA